MTFLHTIIVIVTCNNEFYCCITHDFDLTGFWTLFLAPELLVFFTTVFFLDSVTKLLVFFTTLFFLHSVTKLLVFFTTVFFLHSATKLLVFFTTFFFLHSVTKLLVFFTTFLFFFSFRLSSGAFSNVSR